MATYKPNVSEVVQTRPVVDPVVDNEILNLRPLIDNLIHWWREIFLLTIIAALIGCTIGLYQKSKAIPLYQATAQVAIARVVSNVNLDATFRTDVNSVGVTAQDNSARRAALIGLVSNGTIAEDVIAELDAMRADTTPSRLKGLVSAAFVGSDVSDLLAITVLSDTPEKAAAIANSWTKHYVDHINTLYGSIPTEISETIKVELVKAQEDREAAQQAYENFLNNNEMQTISRLIDEKLQLIGTLQASRQASISQVMTQNLDYRKQIITTYLDAVQQNRLLAFTSEQEANRALVQSLIQTISSNRQLALTTEQNARVQLFTQYADRELQNRLLAMQQEQDAKTQIFKSYSDADIRAKLTVFNEQANEKVGNLVGDYATKSRLEQLLEQATALQKQIEQAGDAGASSNSLPLLLLKIETYATASTMLPGNMVLNLNDSTGLESNTENQATDIATLVDVLTNSLATYNTRIEEASQSLFNNEGYQLLNGERPADDPLYAAIQQQYQALFDVDPLAESVDGVAGNSILSQAILAKYDELFGVGTLTNASLLMTDTTPIYVALEAQYPALFAVGGLAELGDALSGDSALDAAGQQKILEMLQPLDSMETYFAATEAGAEPILQLEAEIRELRAQLEHQTAESATLVNNRDKALEAYNALNNKLLELTLQSTAANREVRFAAAATVPEMPMPITDWKMIGAAFGIAGLLLAIAVSLFASYMDAQPFLSRWRPLQTSPVGQIRNG